MQTRKRGRKRIDGGIQLSNPFKRRAPTQIVDPVGADGLLLEYPDPAVGSAAGLGQRPLDENPVTDRIDVPVTDTVPKRKNFTQKLKSGITSFGSALNGFRSKPQAPANVTDPLADTSPAAPPADTSPAAPPADTSPAAAPPADTSPATETVKIKPDNLLVPMVINLENNYVLVGALKFKITDGNVFKQYIKNAYDIYINQATQSLSVATDAMPSNEKIKAAVRNKVTDEFKDSIMKLLDSKDLDSVADKANNAIELDMGDLFYKIQCIILPETSDDYKIDAIRSLIQISIEQDTQILQAAMLERPVGTTSPEIASAIKSLRTELEEVSDDNVTIPTGNPEQVIKKPPTDRILDEDKEFEANASKEFEKENDPEFEGGARSKKTRKRRQKRSKRKTAHYLRKRH